MSGHMRFLFATAAVIGLTACSASEHQYKSYFLEAGTDKIAGNFGQSTLHNGQIQTGEKSYTVDLANRFAQEVNSTVNFAFNSSRLDNTSRALLKRQADWIKQFPEVRFRVYGHTDAVGGTAFNKRLGLRRAQSVVRYLASQGIGRSRLEAVASFGETQPLIVSQGRELKNRRTVTEVSGFVKRHPSIMDGKYAAVIYREYIASAIPATGLSESTISSD